MFAFYANTIQSHFLNYVNLLSESLVFFLECTSFIQKPNNITSFDGWLRNLIVVGDTFPDQFSFIKHV